MIKICLRNIRDINDCIKFWDSWNMLVCLTKPEMETHQVFLTRQKTGWKMIHPVFD
jgi:hypothetical protein